MEGFVTFAHRLFTLSMVAVALAACGSSDGTPIDPGGPPPDPRIAIGVSVSSLTIEAGASGALTATITRSGGYTGPVTIITTGAPAGVSAVESNVVTSGTTTTGTITVSVAASVAPGSYPLTVTATGTGVSSVQASVALAVTAAPPTPDFALSVASPLALVQGESGTAAVTIDRINFTGAVTLVATGLPAGVSASFSPSAPTGATSALTLQVGTMVAPGSYTLGVSGTGTPGTRTSALTLTVSVAGSYALAASPSTLTVAPSGSVSTTVTVSPSGGFSGAVALSVSGLPAGMSASFNPASTSSTSTLTLVANGAAPGTSALTIVGQTAGLPDRNTPLGVTVMSVTAPTTITLDFANCIDDNRVLWLAYRDGASAPWTPVTGVADRYTFTLNGELGGVAIASRTGLEVLLQPESWLTDFSEMPCEMIEPLRTVAGTATGLPSNATAVVSFGSSAFEVTNASPGFTIDDAPLGAHDLIGYVRTGASVGGGNRAFIRRDVNPPAQGGALTVDFSGSESFTPLFATMSVVGAGGQALTHSMSYLTRTNGASARCDVATLYDAIPGAGASIPAYGVPTSLQRADDLHQLDIRASTTTGQTTLFQQAVESFHSFAARSITLPAPFNPTVTRITGGTHHRLRAQGALPAELEGLLLLSTGQVSERSFGVLASAEWLAGSTVDYSMPDFTGVPGFNPAWLPGINETVDYTVLGVNRFGTLGGALAGGASARLVGSGKEGVL
jgi:hypothetical protein